MNLTAEFQLFIDILNTFLASKIERSFYNRRKRRLFLYIKKLRRKIGTTFIIDSMPL